MAENEKPMDEDDIAKKVEARRAAKSANERLEKSRDIVAQVQEEFTDRELKKRAERKKKIAQLLTRGVVNDRMDAAGLLGKKYEATRRYEWVRETDTDVDRAMSLGFRLEKRPEDWDGEGLHGAGDNRIRLGDTILMSISRDDYSLIEEVKDEQKRARLEAAKREYVLKAQVQNESVPVLNPNRVEA